MKNKAIWVGLASFFFLMGAKAAPVSLETAKKTAEQFYGVQLQKAAVKSLPALSCVYPKSTKSSDFVPYYIFNADKEQGFVIVAGDDNASSLILGYSDKGSFQTENMPDNLKFWLGFYEEGVKNAAEHGGSGHRQAKSGFTKAEVVKEPLLDSINYNQDAPYNDLCPIDPTTNRRSYSGCVATALVSIARYYEYPKHGLNFIRYKTAKGLELSMNFANNTYDWENMLKSYNSRNLSQYTAEQRTAVATLMRDMGYAVQMNYGSDASGATREPTTVGMVQYMGFDSILSYRERLDYDNDDQWIAVLKDNLDNDQPIYYTGYGDGGGHAFVCDGYNDDDFFHFNWGWGGACNGYFSVRNLDPDNISGIGAGTGGGYTSGQCILHNMVPPGRSHCQDEFMLTSSSIISSEQKEDSLYSMKETPLKISFGDVENHAMAFFKGSFALAAFQDGNFLRIISEEIPVEIVKQKTTSGRMSLVAILDSLKDGEYEIWTVFKTEAEDAQWNKIYVSKSNSYTNTSYIPLRVDEDKYELLKTTVLLKIKVDCFDKRNISMFIYSKGENLGRKQVSSSTTAQFNIRPGVYQLRFWTRDYDTTYVDLNLTQDTTLEVKMQETYIQPYIRGLRVEGNTAQLFWFATPQGVTANPLGFIVYLDNVEVARMSASETQYEYTNLSLGEHEAGLSSIFKTGESDIVNQKFLVTTVANETPWDGVCRISPNPSANGYFTLEVDRECRLQVASDSGKVLFERELSAGSHTVDMGAYQAGVYLFRLSGKNGECTVLKAVIR